jgi:Lrp/AsnC family transcriptional regulator, regulator for asnA, asnC and gidA
MEILQKDPLGLATLRALCKDSNRARKSIAHELRVSEPTLSKKASELKDDGYIKSYTIDIDYGKLGFKTHAITLIKMKEQDQLQELLDIILSSKNVLELYQVYGTWDVYVRLIDESAANMSVTIKTLFNHDSVSRTETMIFGEEFRRQWGPEI